MEIRIIYVLIAISNLSYSQDFQNKSWTYSSIYSINSNLQDSTILYSKFNNIRKINIGENNKLVFNNDSTYVITFNNSVRQSGSWKTITNNLVFDKDTLLIITNSNQLLKLRGKSLYFDENDSLKTGFIVIEYIDALENVETVKNGYWSDYSIWNSGRVPNKSDKVIIKQNHKVELRTNEFGFCKDILIEKGAVFESKTAKFLSINPLD